MVSHSDAGDRLRPGSGTPKASLFVTCIVDQFYPDVGESTIRVLQGLGVDVDFPEEQTCCGQPAFNSGFWREAAQLARRFLRVFRGDRYVVVPSGSCAAMVKVFYKELLRDEPGAAAETQSLASRTFELSEFIVDVLGVSDLSDSGGTSNRPADPRHQPRPLRVTYHEACHLRRELNVIEQPRSLIRSVPGVELVEMEYPDECCGFGGTFSVKYPDISGAMLRDKLSRIEATGADTVIACDSSCLMQIAGGMDKQRMTVRAAHLAELLDTNIRDSQS